MNKKLPFKECISSDKLGKGNQTLSQNRTGMFLIFFPFSLLRSDFVIGHLPPAPGQDGDTRRNRSTAATSLGRYQANGRSSGL